MRLTLALVGRNSRNSWFMPRPKVGEVTKKYANLPESYIEECVRRVYWRTPRGINYLPREYENGIAVIGVHRPWSLDGKVESDELENEEIPFVEPIRDWLFFRGDRVQVLHGKDKGKQGIISNVIQERNWVIVKGLNGEIINRKLDSGAVTYFLREKPLLVTSQVALVDPGDLQPTKAEWAYTEDGERVRISVRSGRMIPFSKLMKETYDYQTKEVYKESVKDTLPEDMEVTFVPSLKTFEMDIAEQHGVEENRVPAKFWWY